MAEKYHLTISGQSVAADRYAEVRNPSTGDMMTLDSFMTVSFKPSQSLKDELCEVAAASS